MRRRSTTTPTAPQARPAAVDVVPIADLRWRSVARVEGTIRTVRIQPWAGVATLELDVFDATGGLVVVFTGRRRIPGLELGDRVTVTGRIGERRGAMAMINPTYRRLPAA